MKELDKYTANLTALDSALSSAGQPGILSHQTASVGDFLKLLAVSGIDLTAKCIRPAEQQETTTC